MGGIVAETIRRENGEIIKTKRASNNNLMCFTKEFCDKKFDLAIDNYIKESLEMNSMINLLLGRDNKLYAVCNETYPMDHGLLVIDFQNKKIHSMGKYNNIGYYGIPFLSGEGIDDNIGDHFDYLIKKNLLYVIKKNSNDEFKDIIQYFGEKFSLNKLRTQLDHINMKRNSRKKEFNPDDDNLRDLILSPKAFYDFEFIQYPSTPQSTISLLEKLSQDGFIFNQQELDGWKEKINSFDANLFLDNTDEDIKDKDLLDKKIEENKKSLLNKIAAYQAKNVNKKIKV